MKELHILIALGWISLSNCTGPTDPSRLDSDDYETSEQRVDVLKNAITPFSEIEDAEFELFNVNGFNDARMTIPGPSSWNYKFVVRVNPADMAEWTDDLVPIDSISYDAGWTQKIVQARADRWRTESAPEMFVRKGEDVIVIVHRAEGIIFKSVVVL